MAHQTFNTTWPVLLINSTVCSGVSVLYINLLAVSSILWPGSPYNALDIGFLIGCGSWASAISTILFGLLSDKYSRKILMIICTFFYGISFILNGLVPGGLGNITFFWFIGLNLLRGFMFGGFWPLAASYTNDILEKDQRSQFFGYFNIIIQAFPIIGMITSTLFVPLGLWQQFFWIIGLIQSISAVVCIKFMREPKRGGKTEELKNALTQNMNYNYKITKETLKSTIFSKTNIVAFSEGFLTSLVLGIADILLIPYLQTPPHNLSAFNTSLLLVFFGIPGAIVGSIVFARLSDHYGKKDIKYRIYLMIISIICMLILLNLIFFVAFPSLSHDQGSNLSILIFLPFYWVIGVLLFALRGAAGIYNINQPPIIQEINLPESQGTVSAVNNFLSLIASGTGPVLAGFFLTYLNDNYQLVAIICILFGLIGAILWRCAVRWVHKDIKIISNILNDRAQTLAMNFHDE